MKFLYFSLLFLLCVSAKSQDATDSSMLININRSLNFYDFEQMRSFIFKNGDRKTYCPNYVDNPHYEMPKSNLDIYMNPSAVNTEYNPQELDYNIMFIVSSDEEVPFSYYLYLTDKRDVYLYDFNKYLSDKSVRDKVLSKLNSILAEMKKEMNL